MKKPGVIQRKQAMYTEWQPSRRVKTFEEYDAAFATRHRRSNSVVTLTQLHRT